MLSKLIFFIPLMTLNAYNKLNKPVPYLEQYYKIYNNKKRANFFHCPINFNILYKLLNFNE